jgi:hypothetical protein
MEVSNYLFKTKSFERVNGENYRIELNLISHFSSVEEHEA